MNNTYESPEMEVYSANVDTLTTSGPISPDQTETQPWG